MDFLEKTERYICEKTLFSKEDRVFVACSGGVDSLTLLYTLKKLGYDVACGHVHHGLRETADRDEAHVKACCEAWGISFSSAHVDVKGRVKETKESVEEAARYLRYEALVAMAKESGASHIALAQHAEDEAETVLFHLIRGSGLKGLSGMAPKTEKEAKCAQKQGQKAILFVRPFLFSTKDEIRSFATFCGLQWVEDETNACDDYTRNRMRHYVIPELQKIRPDSVEKILETTEILRAADAYFVKKARQHLEQFATECDGVLSIPCESFLEEEEIVQQYILREAFSMLSVPLKDKTKRHIEILRALFAKNSGAKSILPQGLRGLRSQDVVKLWVTSEDQEDVESSTQFGTLKVSCFPYEKGDKIPNSLYTKWVDCDKIKGTIFLRAKESGDRICLTKGSTKKLQDYFVDEKIPSDERSAVPIVADEEQVIWVVGYRLSAAYYVTDETKTIMEISYEKREER